MMSFIKNVDIRPIYPHASESHVYNPISIEKSTAGPRLVRCICRVGSGGRGESCPIYLNAGYVIAILVLCGPRLEGDSKNLLPTIAQMHKTPKAPNHRSTKTVVVANDQADGGSTAADFRRESRSPTISNLRRSSSRMTPVSLAC